FAFTGTGFGSFNGNFPTTGTITGLTHIGLGSGSPATTDIWSGASISASDFFNWVQTVHVAALQSALFGGADTITGSGVNDNLYGYAGDDHITPGGGSDYVDAGDGNDTVVLGQLDAIGDTLIGGAGTDTLQIGDPNAA